MNHLPEIVNPALRPLEVPYLCDSIEYDGQGFLTFPTRSGWELLNDQQSLITIRRIDTGDDDVHAKLGFIQSWLYYGVLVEVLKVFGLHAKISEFVREQDGLSLISTIPLRAYILEWSKQREAGQRSEARLTLVATAENILDEVEKIDYKLFQTVLKNCSDTELLAGSLVGLSISILRETFRNALWQIERPDQQQPPNYRLLHHERLLLSTIMLKAGWCRVQVSMLADWTDATGLYLASRISRVHLLHEDHAPCKARACLGNQIDTSAYQTGHVVRDCDCSHISVSGASVCDVLARGKIPRVLASQTKDGSVKLEISEDAPYIAISHVWSQGLGNDKENSLPRCQIFRIMQHINAIAGHRPIALWIDTLCIPVASEFRHFRRLAITKVVESFRAAEAVLVLDIELEQASKTWPAVQLGTLLYCCGWMQRLWTFQEGLMANRNGSTDSLLIQLSDGAVSWTDLMSHFTAHDMYHTKLIADFRIQERFPRVDYWLTNGQSRSPTRIQILKQLGPELEARATSRKEDQPVCLAALLAMDLKNIATATTYEERMREFYITFSLVPRSVLFMDGHRLRVDGSRWAANSYTTLESACRSFDTSQGELSDAYAHVHRRGLVLSCSGYIFKLGSRAVHGSEIAFLDSSQRIRYTVETYPGYLACSPDWRTFDFIKRLKGPAVVINPDNPPRANKKDAIVVDIKNIESGLIYARYGCRTLLAQELIGSLTQETNSNERGMVIAEELPASQRWCIG